MGSKSMLPFTLLIFNVFFIKNTMSKPGPKHVTKYKNGEIINDSFKLIEETTVSRNRKSEKKPRIEYLWKCQCNCGEIFYARERTLQKRIGCTHCTAFKVAYGRSIEKSGIINKGIKSRIFREYKRGAKLKNREFKITFDDFIKLSESNCYYCGAEPSEKESDKKLIYKLREPWKRNGIDRVDTTKGYTLENCVPCCTKCNIAKHNLSVIEFKDWVKKCYEHMFGEK